MILSHSPDAQHCSRPPCLSPDTASSTAGTSLARSNLPSSHSGLQGQGSLQQVPRHFPQGFVKQHLNGMHLRLGSLAVLCWERISGVSSQALGSARAEPKESATFQLHSSPACEAWQAGPWGVPGLQPTLPRDTSRNIRGPPAALPSPNRSKGRAGSESWAQADHSLGSCWFRALCSLPLHTEMSSLAGSARRIRQFPGPFQQEQDSGTCWSSQACQSASPAPWLLTSPPCWPPTAPSRVWPRAGDGQGLPWWCSPPASAQQDSGTALPILMPGPISHHHCPGSIRALGRSNGHHNLTTTKSGITVHGPGSAFDCNTVVTDFP